MSRMAASGSTFSIDPLEHAPDIHHDPVERAAVMLIARQQEEIRDEARHVVNFMDDLLGVAGDALRAFRGHAGDRDGRGLATGRQR